MKAALLVEHVCDAVPCWGSNPQENAAFPVVPADGQVPPLPLTATSHLPHM